MGKGCGPYYIPRKYLRKVIPEKVLLRFHQICVLHDVDYDSNLPKIVSDAKMLVLMWEEADKITDEKEKKYFQKWAKRLFWLVRTPIVSHISFHSKGK